MKKETMLIRLVLIAVIVFSLNCQLYAQSVVLTETEIKEDDSGVKILYATNRSISVECYDLAVPPQIVVDFMGDIYTKEPEITMVNKGVVKQMRVIKGTKTSADLDASYYPVDFIIIDLKEAVRYDFDQGLTTSVLMVSKPGKPMAEARAEEAKNAAQVPALEFVKKKTPEAKVPVSMDEKEYEQVSLATAAEEVVKTQPAKNSKQIMADKSRPAKSKKRKTLTRRIKKFFTFGRSKHKTPEQIKAQQAEEAARQEQIKQAENSNVSASKKRKSRLKRTRKKNSRARKRIKKAKVKVEKKAPMLTPSNQVEAAQKKVADLEGEILTAKEQLKTAGEQVKLAEKEQSTIAERIEFTKAKVEAAKDAYDTTIKHMQIAKSAVNSVWLEYSNVKEKLSAYLENEVEKEKVNNVQKIYDEKKVELENAIKSAETAKKEIDIKLEEYNKLKEESEKLSSESQDPSKKVAMAKEEYTAKEKKLKEKQTALEAAKQELEAANLALKQYEIEKADDEYKKSLASIDTQILNQIKEEQRKADEEKRLAEEARLKKLEDEKQAKEQQLRLDELKAKKAKEDAQLAAVKAIEEDNKQKEKAVSKRAVSKRAEHRSKSRKINMPEKKVVKLDNGLRGEVLESAVELRNAGFEMQRKGDFDSAVKYYQQALMQDPKYATVHNDLGILYEQKGLEDKAKMEYLTTLKIDPQYIKAHSNLALLYEKSGDYKKAYYHWKQRVNLGRENDPWTLKAKQRMQMLENRK